MKATLKGVRGVQKHAVKVDLCLEVLVLPLGRPFPPRASYLGFALRRLFAWLYIFFALSGPVQLNVSRRLRRTRIPDVSFSGSPVLESLGMWSGQCHLHQIQRCVIIPTQVVGIFFFARNKLEEAGSWLSRCPPGAGTHHDLASIGFDAQHNRTK
jgi:hypothetical protein